MSQSRIDEFQSRPAVAAEEGENPAGRESKPAVHWREINRVIFVAAAAAALSFLGKNPNPYITAIGMICTLGRRLPDFRGGLRKYRAAPHDDGALDGYRDRRGARHTRN